MSGYEIYIFLKKSAKLHAKSGDPDQMPHSAMSDLGLQFANYPFMGLPTNGLKTPYSSKIDILLSKKGLIYGINPESAAKEVNQAC